MHERPELGTETPHAGQNPSPSSWVIDLKAGVEPARSGHADVGQFRTPSHHHSGIHGLRLADSHRHAQRLEWVEGRLVGHRRRVAVRRLG